MAGGKRKGAGRPRKEPTTTIRVPVSLVERFKAIIELHHGENDNKPSEGARGDSIDALRSVSKIRKSSPSYDPILSKYQLSVFRRWLVSQRCYKSLASARKATSNPSKCKRVFLKTAGSGAYAMTSSMECVCSRYAVP
jgi:hypothetical protein